MLKDHEPPKEPASETAKRKWRNHQVRQQFLEKKQAPKLVNTELQIAETITNDRPRPGTVEHFQSQFIKDMRAIFEGNRERDAELYRQWLQHRKIALLREKLRRLKAAEQSQEEASK
jgi:hypothetical protein